MSSQWMSRMNEMWVLATVWLLVDGKYSATMPNAEPTTSCRISLPRLFSPRLLRLRTFR